jgi:hypothetical protein
MGDGNADRRARVVTTIILEAASGFVILKVCSIEQLDVGSVPCKGNLNDASPLLESKVILLEVHAVPLNEPL